MSFMKPQIESFTVDHVTPSEDDIIISDTGSLGSQYKTNCDDFPGPYSCDRDELLADILNDMETTGYSENVWYQDDHGGMTLLTPADSYSGYTWRLSAPGYMDCTEWSGPHKTILDVVDDMLGMYGDEFDREDWEIIASELASDGFDKFFDSYLVTMAFTGTREVDRDSETAPLFDTPGGEDFSQYVNAEDILDCINDSQFCELIADCVEFFIRGKQYFGDRNEQAGADFHFTRNGHGVGFWDRDYYHSHNNELTELAKPYGSCELTACGRHIDHDFDGYEGSDACLETSLFEYGLIWTTEPDDDGDIKFVYPIKHDDNDNPTMFDWGCIKANCDVRKEFNWIDWNGFFKTMGQTTPEDASDWFKMETGQKVYDIVSQYGTENVFGTSYTEGTPILCDDTMKMEIIN